MLEHSVRFYCISVIYSAVGSLFSPYYLHNKKKSAILFGLQQNQKYFEFDIAASIEGICHLIHVHVHI